MKELSIQEKAKCYDKALHKAESVIEQNPLMEYLKKGIEYIFPELAESEDEMIRKRLIHLVNKSHEQGGYALHKDEAEEMIAWLEAQSEHANFRNNIQIGDKVTRNKDGVLVNLSQLNRVAKRDEKQGEQPKKHDVCDNCDQQGSCVFPCPMKLVEKQGEQKPVDKVEPKFHEDEWVVTDKNNVVQIKAIENGKYVLKNTMRFTVDYVDKCWRKWTIQDAKDGDVLYLQKDGKEHIIIYKGVTKDRFGTFVSVYCGYNGIVDAFCFADVSRYVDIAYGGIMPATKEQRDTLMKVMADDGYEWDAERKELKKIEQKPSWSEKDNVRQTSTIQVLEFAHSLDSYNQYGKEDIRKNISWLKSIKDRVQLK